MRDFYRMTGNLNELYGLANLDALSNKRQRVLPARCRVYDLLNFASEIATHHSTPEGARSMQACIGTLISDEYDLEGTAETATEFADFFVQKFASANGKEIEISSFQLGESRSILIVDGQSLEIDVRSNGYDAKKTVFLKGRDIPVEIEDYNLARLPGASHHRLIRLVQVGHADILVQRDT